MNVMEGDSIILFDGYCNMCSRLILHLRKIDQDRSFRFVSIQSEEGESILKEHQKIPEDPNSVILLDGDNVLEKSDVLIEICKDIGGYHRFFAILLAVFPKFFRDYFYRLIASKRYRIFGKRNTCMKPSNFEE